MRILLYYHDLLLPYSSYIIEAIKNNPSMEAALLLGPERKGVHAIFKQGSDTAKAKETVIVRKVLSTRINEKWIRPKEMFRAIKEFDPDRIIILDEALYWNTLFAGIFARVLQGSRSRVYFYAFENINPTIPFKFLWSEFSLKNSLIFLKKSVNILFFSWLFMPLRHFTIAGGLSAYPECTRVVYKQGWRPKIKEQWWGLDLSIFRKEPSAETLDDLRKSLALNPQKKVIGFVGRLVPEKGLPHLVRALSYLDRNAVLLIIGTGEMEQELRKTAKDLGVEDRVLFAGAKTQREISDYYRLMDVFALPSLTQHFWKEQLGRVLIEAMASGLTVIGSDSGAIPWVIGDKNYVFREADPESLAKVADYALLHPKDPDYLKKRAEQADVQTFLNAFLEL